jgi:hypothetical protein
MVKNFLTTLTLDHCPSYNHEDGLCCAEADIYLIFGQQFIILHGFFSVSLPCIVFLSIYSFSWLKMYLVRPVTLLVILSEYCFSVQPFSFSLILITIIYSFAVYYCSVLVFGNLHLYKMPPTDCQLLEKKK